MISLTRRYRFSASHRLHSPVLSEDENRALYGKCNNPYGHGHNYLLEVTARGQRDAVTGMVLVREALDRLVEREILQAYAHSNLNREILGAVPTSEVLAGAILGRLKERWSTAFAAAGPQLEKVCIRETPRNIFEVSADEIE